MSIARNGISWAGLALGAAAVAFNTQAGYSFVSANCPDARAIVLSTAIVSLAVVLIGGFLSAPAWFVVSAPPRIDEAPERAAPRAMLAGVGVLAALLFSLVIVLQGAAALIVQSCQR